LVLGRRPRDVGSPKEGREEEATNALDVGRRAQLEVVVCESERAVVVQEHATVGGCGRVVELDKEGEWVPLTGPEREGSSGETGAVVRVADDVRRRAESVPGGWDVGVYLWIATSVAQVSAWLPTKYRSVDKLSEGRTSPAPLARHMRRVVKQLTPSASLPPVQPAGDGPPRRPGSLPPWENEYPSLNATSYWRSIDERGALDPLSGCAWKTEIRVGRWSPKTDQLTVHNGRQTTGEGTRT
jgi:hypothetical protein